MLALILLGIVTSSALVDAAPCRAPNVGDGKVVVVDNGREAPEGAIIRDGKDVSVTCNGAAVVSGGAASANCQGGTLVPALGTCVAAVAAPAPAPASAPAPAPAPVQPGLTCYIPYIADGNYRTSDGLQLTAGEEVQSGTNIVAECSSGFQLDNVPAASRNCQQSGVFSGSSVSCIRAAAPAPQTAAPAPPAPTTRAAAAPAPVTEAVTESPEIIVLPDDTVFRVVYDDETVTESHTQLGNISFIYSII